MNVRNMIVAVIMGLVLSVLSSAAVAQTAPGTVTTLALASAGSTSLVVQWTNVDNGLSQPAHYTMRIARTTLQWGSVDDIATGSCAAPIVGTSTSQLQTCTITGLVQNAVYQVQMVSFRGTLNNNAVFGGMSNKITVSTSPTPQTLPGKVLGVRMVTRTTVALDWSANTEPDLAGYHVYVGTASRVYDPPVRIAAPGVTATVSGLIPKTTYYFAVSALDLANNESPYSQEVSYTTLP